MDAFKSKLLPSPELLQQLLGSVPLLQKLYPTINQALTPKDVTKRCQAIAQLTHSEICLGNIMLDLV